jgi:FMN hydrolase / 5-amino-6-(5-phospho-D-ribitylamino)uracil phosphatase
LYVGDSPEMDIVGAKGAGMLAAWFNPHHHHYPHDLVKPDYTFKELTDIFKILPTLQS